MHQQPYRHHGILLDELERMALAFILLIQKARHDSNLMWQLYGCVEYTPAFHSIWEDARDGHVQPERLFATLASKVRADCGEDSKLAVMTLFSALRRGETQAAPEEIAALLYLAGTKLAKEGLVVDVLDSSARDLPTAPRELTKE